LAKGGPDLKEPIRSDSPESAAEKTSVILKGRHVRFVRVLLAVDPQTDTAPASHPPKKRIDPRSLGAGKTAMISGFSEDAEE